MNRKIVCILLCLVQLLGITSLAEQPEDEPAMLSKIGNVEKSYQALLDDGTFIQITLYKTEMAITIPEDVSLRLRLPAVFDDYLDCCGTLADGFFLLMQYDQALHLIQVMGNSISDEALPEISKAGPAFIANHHIYFRTSDHRLIRLVKADVWREAEIAKDCGGLFGVCAGENDYLFASFAKKMTVLCIDSLGRIRWTQEVPKDSDTSLMLVSACLSPDTLAAVFYRMSAQDNILCVFQEDGKYAINVLPQLSGDTSVQKLLADSQYLYVISANPIGIQMFDFEGSLLTSCQTDISSAYNFFRLHGTMLEYFDNPKNQWMPLWNPAQ